MDKDQKLTLIFFGIIVLSIIVNIFLNDMLTNIIIAIVQFGCSVAGFVYSIKLIKKKKYGFGITFLVIFSIMLLLYLIAFLVGFIIGLTGSLQSPAMTGNFVADIV